MSGRSGVQVGARDSHEASEAICLRGTDLLTQPGEAVVAAALIVVGCPPMRELFRQALVDEALQRAV
jgi:hypothetical protein